MLKKNEIANLKNYKCRLLDIQLIQYHACKGLYLNNISNHAL